MPDQVLAVERNQVIACHMESDDGWVRVPVARAGFWPVWRPGHESFAYAAIDQVTSTQPRSVVRLATADGIERAELHRSPAGAPPIIGPRLPAYCLWSPDGSTLATVGTSTDGLALYLSDAGGAFTSDPVMHGAPLFPAFSPDGQHIAIHTGNQLTLVTLEEGRSVKTLDFRVGGFRTPAWSPDGRLVFAVPREDGVTVTCSDANGEADRQLATFAGGLALAFRPGTSQLSVATTSRPDTGTFDRLWTIDIDQPDQRQLFARGPFVSYHWAPNGERVALIVPAQTGDGQYSVHCRLADGSMAGSTESFLPSLDYRSALGFFDQYAISHHFWSPAGDRFLVAGRLRTDAVSNSFGDPNGSYVMTWCARRRAPLELLAPAEIGFFRPWTL